MLLIFGIAGVAALTVAAYTRLRSRSPETAAATTRAVRELAAVILVCTRAIESVIDALPGSTPGRSMSPASARPGHVRSHQQSPRVGLQRPRRGLVVTRPPLHPVNGSRPDAQYMKGLSNTETVIEISGCQLQVHAARPLSGLGKAHIVVHLGDVVLLLADQDAVLALREAADGATRLAAWAFDHPVGLE